MRWNFRDSLYLAAALCLSLLSTGCALHESPYTKMDNWAIRQNATLRHFAPYDLIYLPMTQLKPGEDSPMNWHKYGLAERGYNLAMHHTTRVFGKRVRIFAPFVHQVDPATYRDFLDNTPPDVMTSPLAFAVRDTLDALNHYFRNYHKPGRPFVLYGQGQGARILYEAMKRCPNISRRNGFVAAYLPGLVGISVDRIHRDLDRRGIRPAVGEYDTSVVIAWNVCDWDGNDAAKQPDSFVINPLNWQTDTTEAPASANRLSVAYDPTGDHTVKQQTEYQQLCGAAIDLDLGTLRLVPVPGREQELAQVIAQGTAHGLFTGNIAENASKRVRQFIYQAQWHDEIPPVIPSAPERPAVNPPPTVPIQQ